jgi:hypothetical protein
VARSRKQALAVTREPGHTIVFSAENRAYIAAEVAAGRILRLPYGGGYAYFVRYGEGRAVPVSFEYEGTGPVSWQMTVQVIDGQARCVRLLLDSPRGEFLLSDTLRRFPFGRCLEEAVLLSAIELDADGNPIGGVFKDRVTSVPEARRLHSKIAKEHRRRARGKRKVGLVNEETLREVADVYRRNLTGDPTKAVYEHFKESGRPISRSTAGRWVGKARDADLLGAAPAPGIPGETSRSMSTASKKGDGP